MNFTYIFEEDPVKEPIQGNLTWLIPNSNIPAHWMHTEDICKFIKYRYKIVAHLLMMTQIHNIFLYLFYLAYISMDLLKK